MKIVSVALASGYSPILSLRGLNTNDDIGLCVSVAESASDAFELYGTLDAAATDNTNAQLLGVFSGGTSNLPKGIADQAKTWPFLLIRRTSGSISGSFFAAGNPAPGQDVITTAAPSGASYSSAMSLSALGAKWVRIGGSRQMTTSDVFDVFVSNDATLSSSSGAYRAGRINGGGGTGAISVLVSGYAYCIVQRVSGSTAGNIIAACVSSSTSGSLAPVPTLADLPTSATAEQTCWVISRRSMYVYDGSAWNRTLVTDPSFAATDIVYVNPSTGSDDGTGTAIDPIRSVAEVIARIGDNPVNAPAGWLTISLQASITETDINFSCNTGAQSIVLWQDPADISVALRTTISASTAWNVPTGTVGTIQGTASLVPHVGKVFRIVGGARDGAIGFIISVEGSPNVKYVCATGLWTPGVVTPQIGDTIEILSLLAGPATCKIGMSAIVFIAYLSMLSGLHALYADGGQAWLSGCAFNGGCDAGTGGFVSAIGCGASGAFGGIRAEETGGYAEAWNSSITGINARAGGQVHFGGIVASDRVTADSTGSLFNDSSFIWTEDSAAGSIIEIGVSAVFRSAGQVGGRNANGGAVGTIQVHSAGSYVGPVPTIAGAGWQMGVGGVNKNFADVTAGYQNPANFASIGLLV